MPDDYLTTTPAAGDRGLREGVPVLSPLTPGGVYRVGLTTEAESLACGIHNTRGVSVAQEGNGKSTEPKPYHVRYLLPEVRFGLLSYFLVDL